MGWIERFGIRRRIGSASSSFDEAEVPVHPDMDDANHHRRRKLNFHSPQSSTTSTSVTATTATTSCSHNRHVHFDTVSVRRYNRIVGDNPYAIVPLGLDWKYTKTEVYLIDEDDLWKKPEKERVCAQDLTPLELDERIEKLRAFGLTSHDIRGQERRRRIQLASEWVFRNNRDDVLPCPCPRAAILIKRYLTV